MIRKYRATDLESVMSTWYIAQSIAHPFLSNEFVDKVQGMMKDLFIPNSKTWVYETDGELTGFIAMMDNEIGGLFVKPTMQSNGIGTKLLNYVAKNHEKLEVEVFAKNKIGLPFYYKHDFVIIKEYVHKDTLEKVIRMRKLILNQ